MIVIIIILTIQHVMLPVNFKRERERGTYRVTKRERDIEIETERGEAGGEREERDR